jgi:hypothetical protein
MKDSYAFTVDCLTFSAFCEPRFEETWFPVVNFGLVTLMEAAKLPKKLKPIDPSLVFRALITAGLGCSPFPGLNTEPSTSPPVSIGQFNNDPD